MRRIGWKKGILIALAAVFVFLAVDWTVHFVRKQKARIELRERQSRELEEKTTGPRAEKVLAFRDEVNFGPDGPCPFLIKPLSGKSGNFGRVSAGPEIEKLEADLGIELPADYEAFLMFSNGGTPVSSVRRSGRSCTQRRQRLPVRPENYGSSAYSGSRAFRKTKHEA